MSYRKQYIPLSNPLQLLKTIKFMPYFSTDGHKTYFGYPDIRFFFRIPWENYRFRKIQPLPPHYSGPFPK